MDRKRLNGYMQEMFKTKSINMIEILTVKEWKEREMDSPQFEIEKSAPMKSKKFPDKDFYIDSVLRIKDNHRFMRGVIPSYYKKGHRCGRREILSVVIERFDYDLIHVEYSILFEQVKMKMFGTAYINYLKATGHFIEPVKCSVEINNLIESIQKQLD